MSKKKIEESREIYPNEMLEKAHSASIYNRIEVLRSDLCACFCCLSTFKPGAIRVWTDGVATPLCPDCGIDSVLGEQSGYPVQDPAFMLAMKKRWFASMPE
jgi:hypothetical protein